MHISRDAHRIGDNIFVVSLVTLELVYMDYKRIFDHILNKTQALLSIDVSQTSVEYRVLQDKEILRVSLVS